MSSKGNEAGGRKWIWLLTGFVSCSVTVRSGGWGPGGGRHHSRLHGGAGLVARQRCHARSPWAPSPPWSILPRIKRSVSLSCHLWGIALCVRSIMCQPLLWGTALCRGKRHVLASTARKNTVSVSEMECLSLCCEEEHCVCVEDGISWPLLWRTTLCRRHNVLASAVRNSTVCVGDGKSNTVRNSTVSKRCLSLCCEEEHCVGDGMSQPLLLWRTLCRRCNILASTVRNCTVSL